MLRKISAIIGFMILPLLFAYMFWRKAQLKKDPRYTIATTIRQIRTLKNGLQIEYYYFVNNEKFKETNSKNEELDIKYPNGRYLVKFSESHPGVAKILWERPIPDSIRNAPLEGWKEIPF